MTNFPQADRGLRTIFWSEVMTMLGVLYCFPFMLGGAPGSVLEKLYRSPILPSLAQIVCLILMVAGEVLLFTGVGTMAREGKGFQAAKYIRWIKLALAAVYLVVSFFVLSPGHNISRMIAILSALCNLFIYYGIMSTIIYMACCMGDTVTLSMAEHSRMLLVAAYALVGLTLVINTMPLEENIRFAMTILNLVMRTFSGVVFLVVLRRAIQLQSASMLK